jgi:hypothetical protein
MQFPQPREFWWLPVSDHRHAFKIAEQTTHVGATMTALCGATVTRPNPPSDLDWLAKTCAGCWTETCILVGLRARRQ